MATDRYSTVCNLLLSSCPTAITWFIIPIIVYAIYGQFMAWTQSHIGKEISEFPPSFADRNSSSAIIFVGFVFWVFAALMECQPRVIFWSLLLPGMTMNEVWGKLTFVAFDKIFFCETSAATCSIPAFSTKRDPRHFLDCPAIAQAYPIRALSDWRMFVSHHNEKPSKLFANEIDQMVCHAWSIA